MALSKLLVASLCVSFLLLHLSDADQPEPAQTLQDSAVHKKDCNRACSVRCRKSSRRHQCQKARGRCCRRCNCVPPPPPPLRRPDFQILPVRD